MKQRRSGTTIRAHRQRGSSMLEGLFAICFLLFIFLAMLQIFQWVARQMISDYASFYGAKALALGYAGENCRKATRVAAMGMSGRDMSTGNWRLPLNTGVQRYQLRNQAEIYMRMGEGSGVNFEYWKPVHSTTNGELQMSFSPFTTPVVSGLELRNAPLLVPAMGRVLNLSSGSNDGNPNAPSQTRMYNYAHDYLDE